MSIKPDPSQLYRTLYSIFRSPILVIFLWIWFALTLFSMNRQANHSGRLCSVATASNCNTTQATEKLKLVDSQVLSKLVQIRNDIDSIKSEETRLKASIQDMILDDASGKAGKLFDFIDGSVSIEDESKIPNKNKFITHQKRSRHNNIIDSRNNQIDVVHAPSYKYETSRRRLISSVDNIYNFLEQNKDIKQESKIHQYFADLKSLFQYDLGIINDRDHSWRAVHLNKLKQYIHESIVELQNPANCSEASRVICDLNKACGFGCQMHHLVYCLITGLATNQTIILKENSWIYTHKSGSNQTEWKRFFLPIGKCDYSENDTAIIQLPLIDLIRNIPDYLPLSVPDEMKPMLSVVHGNPSAWFIGQMANYLLRNSDLTAQKLKRSKSQLYNSSPIVGVHIRRTDKIFREAQYHSLDAYMVYVKEFYDTRERMTSISVMHEVPSKRLVYLATDDRSVWDRDILPYKDKGYIFLGDPNSASSAEPSERYSVDSLDRLIIDIFNLADSDHLVCTFSSQVCRLSYELMQARRDTDKSNSFRSLDDQYYFGGQGRNDYLTIMTHNRQSSAERDIDLGIGDLVGVDGNLQNGYSIGENRRTRLKGIFPSYKVRNMIKYSKFKALKKLYQYK